VTVKAVTRRLSPGETDHEQIWLWTGVGGLTLLAVIRNTIGVPPLLCPLKALSGWPCPGCGTLRAATALLEGAWLRALELNPLVTLAALAWGLWACYAAVVLLLRLPRVRVSVSADDLSVARCAIVVAVACVWCFLVLDGR
jgi:hypothetical protein